MKLELGSGDRPTPGYVHLDERGDLPDIGIVGDATRLDLAGVDPLSCEEIRATHLLEHFSHRQTVDLLKHWRTYLKPGGTLYLEVPDLAGHVAAWRRRESTDEMFVEYLYGRQDYEGNYHRHWVHDRDVEQSVGRRRSDRDVCAERRTGDLRRGDEMSHVRIVLNDGSSVSCQPQHATSVMQIDAEIAAEKREWIADLRARHVRAAHPDDGWVDREANTVRLIYPQYSDDVEVGALLALGSPGSKTRIVRITAIEPDRGLLALPDSPPFCHFEAA